MEYWIIGAGRFGGLAVARLLEKDSRARILVVDQDADALAALEGRVATASRHGAEYLAENLVRGEGPDWIVPAAPVHVACLWVMASLEKDHGITVLPVPEEAAERVPHPMRGAQGELYASHADFFCPDNCPEPADRCFVTGLPRKPLFEILAGLDVPGCTPVVVRSHQLAPGVGGYTPEALLEARGRVLGVSEKTLFATACRCHGVIHCFKMK